MNTVNVNIMSLLLGSNPLAETPNASKSLLPNGLPVAGSTEAGFGVVLDQLLTPNAEEGFGQTANVNHVDQLLTPTTEEGLGQTANVNRAELEELCGLFPNQPDVNPNQSRIIKQSSADLLNAGMNNNANV
ncbi:MAG: hypothetical protein U9N55_09365, partial [candidate division Zixibacteria bacterium]|nr:hypothetical protein [candidate division Zixibacteria bacterium]